ncbi:MAG: hypothetical protein QGM50_09270 [Anaerolineae bacterium]|nr:hypothetical protein [Anaerolineae bacterium]MDK1081402.1 hypothetical protein [Anaerolineae bacterium]MDK1118964.1 hypothetical protein [Anaerolineae bacterium]
MDKKLQGVNIKLKRKIGELTAIITIGKAVVSMTDQRNLFKRIVETAVKVVEADLGWLMLREESKAAIHRLAQSTGIISLSESPALIKQ